MARVLANACTLFAGWDSLAINPALYRSVGYDPLPDFVPIIHLVSAAQVLAVRPTLLAHDLAGFRSLARAQGLSIGPPGNGSIGHLTGEMLKARTGVKWTHVPYRGGGSATTELLLGHLDGVMLTFRPAMLAYQSEALGIIDQRRSSYGTFRYPTPTQHHRPTPGTLPAPGSITPDPNKSHRRLVTG